MFALSPQFQKTIAALLLTASGLLWVGMPIAYASDGYAASPLTRALEAADREGGNNFGCLSLSGQMLTGCLAWASYTVMTFAAWLAGGASVVLNYAVQELVVGMGMLVGNLTGITDAWIVLRDIANVFLLFLTIFIGIATILNLSAWNYKQLLWKVVIAALFVNFSMFFTKIVIDVSNLAATELYALIMEQKGGTSAACATQIASGSFTGECIDDGIAGAFWDQMRLATFYDISQIPPDKRDEATQRMIWVGALGTILFLVAAFVFGAAAFLLIGRFVILVLLIILSPVAFVMWITRISGSGSQWWHKLLNQAFFAPAIFLMWWIALKIMTGLNARYMLGSQEGYAATALMTTSGISLLFYFVIVMGFLIASLIVARNLGAAGAGAVLNTGERWARGAAGLGFAYTAGAISNDLATRYTRRHAQANEVNDDGTYKDNSARARMYRRLSGTMIDRGVQQGLSAGARTGVLGTRSYEKRREDAARGRDERRSGINLQGSRDALVQAARDVSERPAGSAEYESAKRVIMGANQSDIDWARREHTKLFSNEAVLAAHSSSQTQSILRSSSTLQGESSELRAARYKDLRSAAVTAQAPGGTLTPEQQKVFGDATITDIENNRDAFLSNPKAIGHVSNTTFEKTLESSSFSDTEKAKLKEERVAALKGKMTDMTPEKFDDLLKSKVYTDAEKAEFRQARTLPLATALNAPAPVPADVAKEANKLSQKDLENLDPNILTNPLFVANLKGDKFGELVSGKQGKLKPEVRQKMIEARNAHYQSLTPTAMADTMKAMKSEDIATLDAQVLTKPYVMDNLSVASMIEMVKKQNEGVRDAIRTHWSSKYAPVRAKLAQDPNAQLTPEEEKARQVGEWLNSPTGGTIF